MVGNLKVGDQIQQTIIRFRNLDNFEAYINAIDKGNDVEMLFSMVIFIGLILQYLKK